MTNQENVKVAGSNEMMIVYSMIGAAMTVFLLGMILPTTTFFGLNVNYLARLLCGIAGVLVGEAVFMYKIISKRNKTAV